MNASHILTAAGVTRSYLMGDSQIDVLKGVDLAVKPGEFVAIEGRSGSGKSTLLHILGSLESVTGGQTHFHTHDYTLREPPATNRFIEWCARWQVLLGLILGFGLTVFAAVLTRNHLNTLEYVPPETYKRLQWLYDQNQIGWATLVAAWFGLFLFRIWQRRGYRHQQNSAAALRRTEFGFIFQFYHLLPELNVLENVAFPAMVDAGWLGYLRKRSQLRHRATQLLTELGMEHRLKHKPAQLSGGERQRVAIARALMNSPKVLFADEPTGNLDIETGKQIMRLLEDLHQKKGQTIVMVTHDRAVARQADRVVVMADGRLHAVAKS